MLRSTSLLLALALLRGRSAHAADHPCAVEEADSVSVTYEHITPGDTRERVFFSRDGLVIGTRRHSTDFFLCPIGDRIAVKWVDYQDSPVHRVVLVRRVQIIVCRYERDLEVDREEWWRAPGFIGGCLSAAWEGPQ
jgi:hypothetical protein